MRTLKLVDRAEFLHVSNEHLVSGNDDIEFDLLRVAIVPLCLADEATRLLAPHRIMVHEAIHVCPGLELAFPVADSAQRHDDEERTVDVLHATKMLEQSNHLHRLA